MHPHTAPYVDLPLLCPACDGTGLVELPPDDSAARLRRVPERDRRVLCEACDGTGDARGTACDREPANRRDVFRPNDYACEACCPPHVREPVIRSAQLEARDAEVDTEFERLEAGWPPPWARRRS